MNDKFLFIFRITTLPEYSKFLNISNFSFCITFNLGQFLFSIIFLCELKSLFYLLPIVVSLLNFYFLLIDSRYRLGKVCYYVELLTFVVMLCNWVNSVLKALDKIVLDFYRGLYYTIVKDFMLGYFCSAYMIVGLLLLLYFIFMYSRELNFEEIRRREEERSGNGVIEEGSKLKSNIV